MPYEIPALRKPQSIAELDRGSAIFQDIVGNDINKRGNLSLIDDDMLVYASVNCVVFEHLETKIRKFLFGLDEGGVSCVAVHPSREMLAVAGRGFNPRIFIYSYPDLEVLKILNGGAERGYASMNFTASGSKLASVATGPDFLLTVWDWENEAIGLHAKAFGQDVFSVKFSLDDDRRLTTSGTGHIRFWKMAATFTGLKLQGYIGKFGKVDLSDIATFVELPDGKVLSGSESGSILMWEGNFIKCRFIRSESPNSPRQTDLTPRSRYSLMRSPRSNKIMCHAGEINYIDLDRDERTVITAGEDGWIRWWDFDKIDDAEVDSDVTMDFEIYPKAEYFLGEGRGIKSMVDSGVIDKMRYFIILDKLSNLIVIKFDLEGKAQLIDQMIKRIVPAIENISSFHSGAITGCDTSPKHTHIATAGTDGSVKLFDYFDRKLLITRKFNSPATCIRWLPTTFASLSSTICFAVGFEDGVIRFFSTAKNALTMVMVMKPHTTAITCLAFSANSKILSTSGKDGVVWFFDCSYLNDSKQLDPLRFVIPVPAEPESGKKFHAYCDKLQFDPLGLCVLACCSDGVLREIDATKLIEGKNSLPKHFDSYLTSCIVHEHPVKISIVAPAVKTASGASTKAILDTSSPDEEKTVVDSPESPGKEQKEFVENYILADVKVLNAWYVHEIGEKKKIIASCRYNDRNVIGEYQVGDFSSFVELKCGLHSTDGKDYMKVPNVSFLDRSKSGKYLLLGCDDGSAVIRPSKFLSTFFRLPGHASSVTSIVISFDDRYVMTTGRDGALVIYEMKARTIEAAAVEISMNLDAGIYGASPIKPLTKDDVTIKLSALSSMQPTSYEAAPCLVEVAGEVEDITPGSYSIEDKKQKMGLEEVMLSAEEKKEATRVLIAGLQRDFKQIVQRNNEIATSARLTKKELIVDPELVSFLEDEGEIQLEEVRKLCAYENEKALKLKDKLYTRLMDACLVEKMPLSDLNFPGFDNKSHQHRTMIFSICTRAMDSMVEDILNSVRTQEKKNAIIAAKEKMTTLLRVQAEKAVNEVRSKLMKDEAGNFNIDSLKGHKGEPRGTNSKARKEMRLERKTMLSDHLQKKPNELEDDVRDVEAIRNAEAMLGDYKPKASEDYRVPVGQEINAAKKRRQMVLLEESMIVLRLQFNERFLALRLLKKQLVESITNSNKRVRAIDIELQQPEKSLNLWEPTLDPVEFPDDRNEFTEVELEAFKRARMTSPWIKAVAPMNSIVTGTQTSISVDLVTGEYNVLQNAKSTKEGIVEKKDELMAYKDKKYFEVDDRFFNKFASKDRPAFAALEQCIPSLYYAKESLITLITQEAKFSSPVLLSITADRRARLEYERRMIFTNMQQNLSSFRSAIEILRKSRHEATANIKLAELKLLVQFQEYQLLQTFESKDLALQNKRLKCQKEKNEIVSNLTDFQSKLDGKIDESKDWQVKLATTLSDMTALVPENHQFFDILTRIYKKKVKPSKSGNSAPQGDDDDEEEEEEEEEEDGEEDEMEVEDICPPGCDKHIYERVILLRESRAENEEQLGVVNKAADELKRNIDRQKQKEKQIDKDTKQAESEIQQFQITKQAAMNLIDIFIPVKISQIYPFQRSGLMSGPDDKLSEDLEGDISILLNTDLRVICDDMAMQGHILIQKDALSRLQNRIGELGVEIDEAKADLKTLHKQRSLIEKSLKINRADIEEKEARVLDVQMLKLGRQIDLDDLEQQSDRSWENEIEANITDIEEKFRVQQSKLMKEQEILSDKLIEVTKRNTELLARVAGLTSSKLEVARELNSAKIESTGDTKLVDQAEKEENDKVMQFVKTQEKELALLRNEIFVLKRKDVSQSLPYLPSPPVMPGKTTSFLPPIPTGSAGIKGSKTIPLKK